MSFADPSLPRDAASGPDAAAAVKSVRVEAARRRAAAAETDTEPVERPRGSSFRRTVDWEHVGLVGAGLLVGALVGAGAALLLAPRSGEATRAAIRRGARGAKIRAGDVWADFADDLAAVAHRGRRRVRRGVRKARWRASDAIS
ncbi:MAG TPA: YtxH domain-containing protein [Gemmatimonadaceae bacterium]|nr:YtxH domain-containing protein [Gemmatimonadaceae bacterium]